jgi:Ca-activated chloride channel homolog
MRRQLKFVSVMLLLALCAPAQNPAQEKQKPVPVDPGKQNVADDDVVRVDTNLVTIPAMVMDRDGRYVTNLGKEDFQIFEEGVEQEIAFFAPVEKPFTILFLLDTSGSMFYWLKDMARSANAFFDQLRPDDQIIVATFNDHVEVLNKGEKVKNIREEHIKFRLKLGGRETRIYDAVDDALKRMRKVEGRKAIVLFSDGYGRGVSSSAKSNLRMAEELDVLIYTLTPFPSDESSKYMRDLAQITGGRSYELQGTSDLATTFGFVADELRRQYSLGYYPKQQLRADERREVKVKVRLPGLSVRARDSYIVKPSKNDR